MGNKAKNPYASKVDQQYLRFMQKTSEGRSNVDPKFRRLEQRLISLSRRVKKQIDVFAAKSDFSAAIYRAACRQIDHAEEWPKKKAHAQEFVSRLTELIATLKAFKKFEPESLSEVLVNVTEELRQEAKYGAQFGLYGGDVIYETTSRDAEIMIDFLRHAEIRIRRYLDVNLLPKYQHSNRKDHFIHCFVHESADIWRKHVCPTLQRGRDRLYFVGLLGSVLDDVGYPRSAEQAGDNWLYGRVGSYKIWN
jgi:hypothetical protein